MYACQMPRSLSTSLLGWGLSKSCSRQRFGVWQVCSVCAMLAAAEHDLGTYTANFSVCKQNGMPTMLMNMTTVANTYAMKSAQPAVRTQRTRLIVKIGSLLDQTIRR